MIEVRFEDYVRNVRANAQTAAVLAARLEKAAPDDLTREQRKALRAVIASARDVQAVQSERDRVGPTRLRQLREPFVNDWSALYESLGALARVSAEVSELGPAAVRLVESLFPDGVAFVLLPSDRAWSEAKRRLDRISAEGLGQTIETLVGGHFVEGAKRSTAQLANAIGTGKDGPPVASGAKINEELVKFGRTVGTYGRLLAASVDESDEESVRRFLAALAPVDHHRAASARTSGGGEPEPIEPIDPDEPASPVVVAPTPAPNAGPTLEPAS